MGFFSSFSSVTVQQTVIAQLYFNHMVCNKNYQRKRFHFTQISVKHNQWFLVQSKCFLYTAKKLSYTLSYIVAGGSILPQVKSWNSQLHNILVPRYNSNPYLHVFNTFVICQTNKSSKNKLNWLEKEKHTFSQTSQVRSC